MVRGMQERTNEGMEKRRYQVCSNAITVLDYMSDSLTFAVSLLSRPLCAFPSRKPYIRIVHTNGMCIFDRSSVREGLHVTGKIYSRASHAT